MNPQVRIIGGVLTKPDGTMKEMLHRPSADAATEFTDQAKRFADIHKQAVRLAEEARPAKT